MASNKIERFKTILNGSSTALNNANADLSVAIACCGLDENDVSRFKYEQLVKIKELAKIMCDSYNAYIAAKEDYELLALVSDAAPEKQLI